MLNESYVLELERSFFVSPDNSQYLLKITQSNCSFLKHSLHH